jgi:anti-sigma factor RsiW
VITWMQSMVQCRRSAARLEQYLDADPSAPLPADERQRLAAHLAVCDRCTRAAARHRLLRTALHRLGDHHRPDAASLARLQHLVHTIATDDDRSR